MSTLQHFQSWRDTNHERWIVATAQSEGFVSDEKMLSMIGSFAPTEIIGLKEKVLNQQRALWINNPAVRMLWTERLDRMHNEAVALAEKKTRQILEKEEKKRVAEAKKEQKEL